MSSGGCRRKVGITPALKGASVFSDLMLDAALAVLLFSAVAAVAMILLLTIVL
jgi:hypothetical protein